MNLLGLGLIGGALAFGAYTLWGKESAKPESLPGSKRVCKYNKLAVDTWLKTHFDDQGKPYAIFVATSGKTNMVKPPEWIQLLDAGWLPDMIQAQGEGKRILLITVEYSGRCNFWTFAPGMIGPTGPVWIERTDLLGSYCDTDGANA